MERVHIKPRDIARRLFVPTADRTKYQCKICIKNIKKSDGQGWTNLARHAKSHKDWHEDYAASGTQITQYMVPSSEKKEGIMPWIVYIVMKLYPFSDVECPIVRGITSQPKDNHYKDSCKVHGKDYAFY